MKKTQNHTHVVLSSPLHIKGHRNMMKNAIGANLNAGSCWYQKLNQGTSGRIHSLTVIPTGSEGKRIQSHWPGQRYVRLGGPNPTLHSSNDIQISAFGRL